MKKNFKKRKPFVYRSTIWKAVGGGLSNPNESKVCKIGKHKVLVSRAARLDRYGNPIHTVTYINSDGSLGVSSRGTGSATLTASQTLKKMGIETRYIGSK